MGGRGDFRAVHPFAKSRENALRQILLRNFSQLLNQTSVIMADQQTEYVTHVSSDGFEFKVLRSAACLAGAIKRMLDPTSVSCPLLHPLTL
jgi:hypothetical protein